MVTPETLAAALRVAQHGARSAMLAARALATGDSQASADLSKGAEQQSATADRGRQAAPA